MKEADDRRATSGPRPPKRRRPPTDKDIPGLSAALDFICYFNSENVPHREVFLEVVAGWYRLMKNNEKIQSTSSGGLMLQQRDGEFMVWVDANLWKNP